jgi:predicted lipoprotein
MKMNYYSPSQELFSEADRRVRLALICVLDNALLNVSKHAGARCARELSREGMRCALARERLHVGSRTPKFCYVAAVLALWASAAAAAAPQPFPELTARLVDSYLIPRFSELDAATRALADDLDAGCAGNKERLTAARADFDRTVLAWGGVEFLRFGPMSQTGRPERFDFWPDPRGFTDRQLRLLITNRDPAALDPAALEKKSVAVQGLTVLESLMTDNAHPLAADDEEGRYRCKLAGSVARNLAGISHAVLAELRGDDGWRSKMLHAGADSPTYRSAAEPPAEFARALITGLQLIQDREVAPLAAAQAAPNKPARLPFARSGLNARYVSAGVASLKDLYEALGIASSAPKDKAWIPKWITTAFARLAVDAPAALKENAGAKDPKERERDLRMLRFHVEGIRKLVGRELAPAAGLTLGFNELDGD